jgi:hypothetical protein
MSAVWSLQTLARACFFAVSLAAEANHRWRPFSLSAFETGDCWITCLRQLHGGRVQKFIHKQHKI